MKTDSAVTKTRIGWGVLAAVTLSIVGCVGCGGGSGSAGNLPITGTDLSRAVSTSRTQAKIPAMYAAVMDTQNIVVQADGIRKQDTTDTAQATDRVHLGSNTKAMTAAVIATFVEEGKMRWDMTLGENFPELVASMRPEYQNVTLAMLLEMRGGVVAVFDAQAFRALPTFPGTLTEQRRAFTQWALQQSPDPTVGEYNYSNGSYIVVTALLEKVTSKAWDDLLQDRLLRPLGISTLSYGWPASNGARQPWGHLTNSDGTFTPHNPDNPEDQLPRYLAPAGDLSMSIGDYAKFVQMNLRGLRGEQTLLRSETIKRMHTPPANSTYALGWAVEPRNGVQTSFYVGSLEPFLADVWIQPSRNRAVTVVTNTDTDTFPVVEALCGELVGDTGTATKAAPMDTKSRK